MKINRLFAYFSIAIAWVCYTPSLKAQNKEVKLFAHRGGMAEFDENTLSAFEQAYKKGMDGFETDVRMTKDGHLVLFHDDNLKRIIGIEGSVEDLTLAELKKLTTKKGNKIPTLDEFLSFLKGKDHMYVEFEMKTQKPVYDGDWLQKYCDQLYQKATKVKGPNSTFLFTSFDKRPLRIMKAKDSNVGLMFIKAVGISQELLDEAKELGINRVGCRVEQTTRKMVDQAKKQGFIVSLWPGHSVDDFLLGVSLGSDYLCSDIPMEVMGWVKQNGPWIKLK